MANNLEQVFKDFAKFGNASSDGKQMTLKNSDKWMKEAGVIDGKKVTTTDTGICFAKFKAKTLAFKEFMQFVEMLAKEKGLNVDEVKTKLAKCAVPSTANAAHADKSAVVDRMTDPSKYTGTHKERFDAEGKGRGKEGREDTGKDTGYVQGYKGEDTYGKK